MFKLAYCFQIQNSAYKLIILLKFNFRGEVTDFSVGSIQLIKKSKSDYKIEFTGVNIKVLADIAVKKKIMWVNKVWFFILVITFHVELNQDEFI